jgi:hypothetical protein
VPAALSASGPSEAASIMALAFGRGSSPILVTPAPQSEGPNPLALFNAP